MIEIAAWVVDQFDRLGDWLTAFEDRVDAAVDDRRARRER